MRPQPRAVAWRKEIVRRDQQCTICGSTDSLHAHRIRKYAGMTAENGRCLCRVCLRKEHEKNRMPRMRGNRLHRQTLITTINRLQEELAMAKGQKEPPEEIVDKEPTRMEVLMDGVDVLGDDVPVGVDQAPPPEPLPEKPAVDLEAQKAERQAEKERVEDERAQYWRLLAESKRKAQEQTP